MLNIKTTVILTVFVCLGFSSIAAGQDNVPVPVPEFLKNVPFKIEGVDGFLQSLGIRKGDMPAAGGAVANMQRSMEEALLKQLELPEHMSANALLAVLNGCYSREEVEKILASLI